jgi:type IV secretory pathway VirB2 component (pilin)
MKVLVDDQVISDKELASEVPVDPGSRTILVTAPGRLPYTKTVQLAKSQHLAVDVPQLARSVTVKSSRRTIGKIVSISGVAAVGIGIALGTYASHQWHLAVHSTTTDPVTGQPIPNCKPAGDNYICDPQTHTKTETDFTLGKVGTAVGIVGLVAVGVGAYLWLRAPSEGD